MMKSVNSQPLSDTARFEQLQHQSAQQETMLNALHVGMVLVDKSGRFSQTNTRFWDIFSAYPKLQQHPNVSTLSQIIRANPIKLREESSTGIATKDTKIKKVPFETTIIKIDETRNHSGGTLITFRDKSDEIQKKRMTLDFINALTHDLKIPLTTIKVSIDLLYNKLVPDEKQHDILGHTLSGIQQMTKVINNLLMLSKLEAGKMPLKLETTSIATLLKEIVVFFSARAKEKKISIELDVMDSLPFVEVDPEQMDHVFQNLVDNAIKFTSSSGTIRIAAKTKGRHTIAIIVSDSGSGIPKESIPTIFDKFKQASSDSKQKRVGSGLGLAIVREIVTAHKGSISCESELEKGTTFIIKLPVD